MDSLGSFRYMPVPRYRVDLDESPETRWNHIVDKYKQKCKNVLEIADVSGISGIVLSWLVNYYSNQVFYIDELRAISKRAEIPLEKLILLQLCYEMNSCCTSIIFKRNNRLVHYRTMDWQLDGLNDLTICVDFIKQGNVLFSATTWAGYVGVMTAVKPDVCTVALNFRSMGDSIFTNLTKSINGAWPVGFLIRHLMETETKFNKIETYLKNSELISPCYLTMSGPSPLQGSIISRTRTSTDKYKTINTNDFLVQTNVDYDLVNDPTVPNIVYSKERVHKVNNLMQILKKHSNATGSIDEILLFNEWPIINETTIYVTLMCSSTGTILSYY